MPSHTSVILSSMTSHYHAFGLKFDGAREAQVIIRTSSTSGQCKGFRSKRRMLIYIYIYLSFLFGGRIQTHLEELFSESFSMSMSRVVRLIPAEYVLEEKQKRVTTRRRVFYFIFTRRIVSFARRCSLGMTSLEGKRHPRKRDVSDLRQCTPLRPFVPATLHAIPSRSRTLPCATLSSRLPPPSFFDPPSDIKARIDGRENLSMDSQSCADVLGECASR